MITSHGPSNSNSDGFWEAFWSAMSFPDRPLPRLVCNPCSCGLQVEDLLSAIEEKAEGDIVSLTIQHGCDPKRTEQVTAGSTNYAKEEKRDSFSILKRLRFQ
jgi:hypothetical protein